MSFLLDTHFVLWIAGGSKRLRKYPWLDRYLPWTLSPVTLLEIQFLAEIGRVDVLVDELLGLLKQDPRFLLDDPSLTGVARHAMQCGWTRDPFDRLLAGHSLARNLDFCTVDETILAHHSRIPPELRD